LAFEFIMGTGTLKVKFMNIPVVIRRSAPWTLACAILFFSFGCQKIKDILVKSPPEGVVKESYSIRAMGYQQSVTVKASPKDVYELIGDMNNPILPEYKMEETKTGQAKWDPNVLGSSFFVTINQMGLEIPGRIIVIKTDKQKMWWVFDNPLIFTVQRWEFKPVREGTRLNFKLDYEILEEGVLGQLIKLTEFSGLMEGMRKDLDLTLANIQAHFDPTLDPEELVALGLRGEDYETFLQAHKARTWVDAEPEKVTEWMFYNREHLESFFPGKIDEDHVESFLGFLNMSGEGVIYCPSTYQFGGLKFNVDLFTTVKQQGRETIYRMYTVIIGDMTGYIQLEVSPEAGGSRVMATIVTEMPGSASPRMMDTMFVTKRISEPLEQAVLSIKRGVENWDEV